MKNNSKGIFIMSLNSKRLAEAVNLGHDSGTWTEVDALDIFVFDNLEVLNGIFFNKEDVDHEHQRIESIIEKICKELINDNANRRLLRVTAWKKELSTYVAAVHQEFFYNKAFERHCRNQIFHNLRPKLVRYNINNNKSSLLDLLLPFLLSEIALFLKICDERIYSVVYGLEPEMDIIEAIRAGKYQAFQKFINNNFCYQKLGENHA